MTTLTITKIASKPFEGQYGLTNKIGILTEEYGDKYLNGFMNVINFAVGDTIFAEVIQKGDFLNFKYKGKKTLNTVPATTLSSIPKNIQAPPAPDWNKIREEKKENISWMNAKNNACLLIAHGIYANDTGEPIVNLINNLANDIYQLEPAKLTEDENGNLKIKGKYPPFN